MEHIQPCLQSVIEQILFVFTSLYFFTGENIALGQPATQSDTLWDFNPGGIKFKGKTNYKNTVSGLAVDGDLNTTCSFTPRTVDQRWWQVRLRLLLTL